MLHISQFPCKLHKLHSLKILPEEKLPPMQSELLCQIMAQAKLLILLTSDYLSHPKSVVGFFELFYGAKLKEQEDILF